MGAQVEDLCLIRRLRRRRFCSRCSAKHSCFLHRGDPFSPVTHLRFVLGSTRRRHSLLPPWIITSTTKLYLFIRLRCPVELDSPQEAGSPGFEFRHESKVKRRSTTVSPISRLLVPPTLTIDLTRTDSFLSYRTELQNFILICSQVKAIGN